MKVIGLSLLLIVTFVVASFHAGVATPPDYLVGKTPKESGTFIDHSKYGMHQLVLTGDAFERGYNSGRLVHHLMILEERDLYEQLLRIIPNRFAVKVMNVALANYFRGITKFFEPWAMDEMYGVSMWAPKEYDFLTDGFTRQVAYHGLHEVGQMMVDSGVPFACTAIVARYHDNWIVGRNFDFEGGDVFDKEKIMKWVFPSEGQPYVSVIWAGMVGAVTGVNANGLYVSLNAAGSKDFARIGTPSTLVITKVLQFAKNIDEALDIFRREQMFITDIFVVVDSSTKRAFRIEKSPTKTIITELKTDTAITNHLQSPEFAGDATNEWRKAELTSHFRQARGEEMLSKISVAKATSNQDADERVLAILRDKGDGLHLNNRRAIDALIAAHSVVFDSDSGILYVSQGPAVSGAFTGFNLKKSFAEKQPVVDGDLPADPVVSPKMWDMVRSSERLGWKAGVQLKHHDCDGAMITVAAVEFTETTQHHQLLGNIAHECKQDDAAARKDWQAALDLKPAYARDTRALKESLEHGH